MLIAIGTIGAASVALSLGRRAQRASAAQAREARLKLTRQVLAVPRPPTSTLRHAAEVMPDPYGNTDVEVVNASPEVITSVMIVVHALNSALLERIDWEWEDQSLGFPLIRYLLPGQREVLSGGFVNAPPPGGDYSPDKPKVTVEVDPSNMELELMWQDSYGEVWNRRGSNEVFPTSWARPRRDLRDVVPAYLRPGHWPPKVVPRPSPPLLDRARTALARLRWRHRRVAQPGFGTFRRS